jgi:hypothetical protein
VLIRRRLARAVVEERVAGNPELRTDEAEHPLRDDLARLDQPTRIAQRTELKREAQPVLRPTAATNMHEIGGAEEAKPDEHGLAVRKIEQGGALPIRENGASGHRWLSLRESGMFVML